MNARRLYFLSGLVLFGYTAQAQLYVDYGGARNIFYSGASSGSAPNFFSLDTQKEQLGMNFLNIGRISSDVWIGGTVAATSPVSDPTELLKFHESPTFAGTILVNWTNYKSDGPAASFTLMLGNTYASYPIAAPGATKASTTHLNEPSIALSYALATNSFQALAVTAGAERATDYDGLPQVNLTNGQSAAQGPLHRFAAFPVNVMYVFQVNIPDIDNSILKWIATQFGAQAGNEKNGDRRYLDITPYAKVAFRSGGNADEHYGFNLALETLTAGKDKNGARVYSKDIFKYPWTVYIEDQRLFGAHKRTVKVGISAILSLDSSGSGSGK